MTASKHAEVANVFAMEIISNNLGLQWIMLLSWKAKQNAALAGICLIM